MAHGGRMKLARWLVILGTLFLLATALLHLYGYKFVMPVLAATNIPPELLRAVKALWLAMSAQLILLCLVIIQASRLPNGRRLVLLCTLIPAAVTILLYGCVGVFIGSIGLTIATALLAAGGLRLPKS